jgi:hypothetical protein
MKNDRARAILQSLIQGVDPVTGEDPTAGTLAQADVLRALLAGVTALDESATRAKIRAEKPENMGRGWSQEEHEQLVTAFNTGESLDSIALRHRRTVRGIETRLEKHGLLTAEQRTTRDRFVHSEPGERPPGRPRLVGGGES